MLHFVHYFVKQTKFSKQTKLVLKFSLIVHLISAFYSLGPHQWDEYDGIITNTAYLMGELGQEQLSPGETKFQIRSWLQPIIYAGILTPFKYLGLSNPFTQVLILRIFSSLLGWLSLLYLTRLIPYFVSTLRVQLISLYGFAIFWPLPFFHARTTSENLATSFFCFAFYLLIKKVLIDKKVSHFALVFSGFFLALSFTFRNQIAVMILSLALWFYFSKNMNLRSITIVFLSFILTLCLSTALDFLVTHNWHFTPYNNWRYNMVKGVASSLGTDPWYRYITKSFLKLIPPISVFVILSFLFHWFLDKRGVLTAITLPFFIIHCLISHKELRFLYPLLPFFPFVFPSFLKLVWEINILKKLAKFSFILNLIILTISIFLPANSRMGIYRNLFENDVESFYVYKHFPKEMPFYSRNKRFSSTQIKNLGELEDLNEDNFWILTNKLPLREEVSNKANCQTIYDSHPYFFFKILPAKVRKRSTFLSLHHCVTLQ